MMDPSFLKVAFSTHDKIHVIDKGYYACNKAIGKINRYNIMCTTNNIQWVPGFCRNCARKI